MKLTDNIVQYWGVYDVDSAGGGVLVQVSSFTQGVNLSLVSIPSISS